MKKLAIIDLGTNTFHLLIAHEINGDYQIVHRLRLAVKLGMGGINSGIITADAMERGLNALQQFNATLDAENISDAFVMGTSAVRNASNQNEFLEHIKQKFGWKVSVLSGEEEARYIYLGVNKALSLKEEPSLIMDIGGGSVEFIIGNKKGVIWLKSFEIGAQRVLEKFNFHDPILGGEIEQLKSYFLAELSNLFDALALHKPATLVGSSGTFDTLSDIYCATYQISKNENDPETPLTLEGFKDIYDELIIKNRDQRLLIPGMIPMRVDMIVVACYLIHLVVSRHKFSSIRVSSFSLKEGVLSSLISH